MAMGRIQKKERDETSDGKKIVPMVHVPQRKKKIHVHVKYALSHVRVFKEIF